MSFSAEVKDELSRVQAAKRRADLAQLAAIMKTCGQIDAHLQLEVSTETGALARVLIKLVHQVCRLKTELTVKRSGIHKSRTYVVSIPQQEGLITVLQALGIIDTQDQVYIGIKPDLLDDADKAGAFLRGVFLGCGFIAHPKGDFHFELNLADKDFALALQKELLSYGIKLKYLARRSDHVLYLKNGDEILYALAFMGAHNSALSIENVRVLKALRSDINRQVNAELANQKRSSRAALQQIEMIEHIEKTIGFDKLSQALNYFCKLRLRYPELSLRELGELAQPPLSKSAINHRLRRISELAQQSGYKLSDTFEA